MPRSSDPVMIPDPWSDNALRDASRFAPSPCGFVELWQRENGDVSVHTGALPPAGIKEWVREQGSNARRSSDTTGGLRLLLAPFDCKDTLSNEQRWPFSHAIAKELFAEFSLSTTLFQACTSGNRVMVFYKSLLASKGKLAWVMRQLEHAAALSYCVRSNTVRGVVLVEMENLDVFITRVVELKTYACHPMLVPLLIMTQEMERLTDMRRKDNTDTLDIERRIGLRHTRTIDNDFLKHSENAMRDNLELLTMVTNHKADAEMVAKSFMDAIFRSIDLVNQQIPSIRDRASQERMAHQSLELEDRVEYLSQSNTSILASFGALQKRIEAQMSGLYTLMGQRDSRLNLAMAHDSRRLANASKRDSSSMKTIAVLTTVFLPGTFIATVFGMNMVKLSPAEFWVYLAITIPLTVVVLVIWAMWMLWINYQNEKEDERAQEQLPFENPFERPAKDSKRERATLPVVMKMFCQA